MIKRLKEQLERVRADYASEQQQLRDLETRQEELKHRLLRISGAIQCLEEMIVELEKDPA